MKPHLPNVTLLCADTTPKAHLAARAIEKSLEQCSFGAVKLLTDKPGLPHAVQIRPLNGIEEYSRFCVREMWKYCDTSHALVIQGDGYVVNGAAWANSFLSCDYIGAPWWQWKRVGNGGFSLRSRRLMETISKLEPQDSGHPEDTHICHALRPQLERMGMRWAPVELAAQFAFEGRTYDGEQWNGAPLKYQTSFGFHSWLTPLPETMDRPLIFTHSGDLGDVIYSLPVVKALGGGVLFLSAECKFPYPKPPRACAGILSAFSALQPLLNRQDYIWQSLPTHRMPYSTDVDLNAFRRGYMGSGPANWESIFRLHLRAFALDYPEDQPWLECDDPVSIPGRDIVINRTPRYHNERFPWAYLLEKYGDRMVFIGSAEEFETLRGFAPQKKLFYQPTADLWQAARVIKGAKCFVGNQSAPLAIAHGLGQKVLVEVWQGNANCCLKRRDAVYCDGDKAEIPKEWL